MLAISVTVAFSRYTYDSVILHAHPIRGESHNQRNASGEVATVPTVIVSHDVLLEATNEPRHKKGWEPLLHTFSFFC